MRSLREDETSWCKMLCPPLHNVMMGPSQNSKNMRVRDIHGLEELLDHGIHELGHLCVQYHRSCFASGTLGPGQASTLFSSLRRNVLLARSCGADLADHQTVFRTLWVHRSWSLAIPTEFRTPVSHEIVLSVAVSLQNVPELSLSVDSLFASLFVVSSRGQAASSMVRRTDC